MIISALQGKNLPVYGDGRQIRDWIYVNDHIEALKIIIKKGKKGEHYNIGGNNTIRNINLIRKICSILDFFLKKKKSESFIKKIIFVKDRPAHDTKYAVCSKKISTELGWHPSTNFNHQLKLTIKWYLDNENWWKNTINKKNKLKRIGLMK
jgi:dTDP-glucose 4,6-dehydratase